MFWAVCATHCVAVSVCLTGCRRWLDSQRRLAELEAQSVASRGASPQPAMQQPVASPGPAQDAANMTVKEGAADVVYDVEVITADCKVGAHVLEREVAPLCKTDQQGGTKPCSCCPYAQSVSRP